jgi:hypothetical protein
LRLNFFLEKNITAPNCVYDPRTAHSFPTI